MRVCRVAPDDAVGLGGYFGLIDEQRLDGALRFELFLDVTQLQFEGGGVGQVKLGFF